MWDLKVNLSLSLLKVRGFWRVRGGVEGGQALRSVTQERSAQEEGPIQEHYGPGREGGGGVCKPDSHLPDIGQPSSPVSSLQCCHMLSGT